VARQREAPRESVAWVGRWVSASGEVGVRRVQVGGARRLVRRCGRAVLWCWLTVDVLGGGQMCGSRGVWGGGSGLVVFVVW
jgi:hypothetical protein